MYLFWMNCISKLSQYILFRLSEERFTPYIQFNVKVIFYFIIYVDYLKSKFIKL